MKTATLLAALKTAKPALLSQDFVPVLTHFCFDHGETVYAYNDVCAIVVPVNTGLDLAVRGDTLLGVLESMGEQVTLEAEDGGLVIASGSSVVKLPFMTPEEFLFNPPDEEPNIRLPFNSTMAEALQLCSLTITSDATRPELNGITVEITPDGVKFYSSDNKAVTCVDTGKTMKGAKKPKTVVIPTTTADFLLSLYNEWKGEDNEIAFGDTILAAMFGEKDGPVLISKLLQVKVAPFASIIQSLIAKNDAYFAVPKELKSALTKADIVIGNMPDRKCELNLEAGELFVSVKGGRFGDMNEDMPCKAKAVSRLITDPALALRVLSNANEMAMAQRALLFRHQDDERTYLNVINTYSS